MFKPKTPKNGCLDNSSEEWIQTNDHKVMSVNPETEGLTVNI